MDGHLHAPAALPPVKTWCPFLWEAGWAPGPVWTGVENIASTGFDHRTVPLLASQINNNNNM